VCVCVGVCAIQEKTITLFSETDGGKVPSTTLSFTYIN
jgi:hypothetical protein